MQSWEMLEKAQLPDPQAKAILAVVELEITRHWGTMATQADLRAESALLRSDLRYEIGQLRDELHVEIGKLREEMHLEIGKLREDMRAEISRLRLEVAEALHQHKVDLIKWAVGIAFAQMTMLMAFCYFLVSHLVK